MQVFDTINGPFFELFATNKKIYFCLFSEDGVCTKYTVTTEFSLNTKYTIKAEVQNGTLDFYYNGDLSYSFPGLDRAELYFKTGDYCQSTLAKDPPTDYCMVYIHALTLV